MVATWSSVPLFRSSSTKRTVDDHAYRRTSLEECKCRSEEGSQPAKDETDEKGVEMMGEGERRMQAPFMKVT